jgi:hypothetical protein
MYSIKGDALMTEGIEKLGRDLEILSAMAAEMDSYLNSDVLFWHMSTAGMPALTLGGYLMRQYRLLALRDLLAAEQELQMDAAIAQYHAALVEKIVRFEQKATHELDARLRQWEEYLKDVERGQASKSNYSTAVEARAMIDGLIDQLEMPPYEFDPRYKQRVALQDAQLRRSWDKGDFVWPAEWAPAYPASDYWWLYGEPREKKRS